MSEPNTLEGQLCLPVLNCQTNRRLLKAEPGQLCLSSAALVVVEDKPELDWI